MPEIIVRAESEQDGDAAAVMRERVTQRNLESEHYAGQLIERIGWAVVDASEAQAPGYRETDRPKVAARWLTPRPQGGRPSGPSSVSVAQPVLDRYPFRERREVTVVADLLRGFWRRRRPQPRSACCRR